MATRVDPSPVSVVASREFSVLGFPTSTTTRRLFGEFECERQGSAQPENRVDLQHAQKHGSPGVVRNLTPDVGSQGDTVDPSMKRGANAWFPARAHAVPFDFSGCQPL